MKWLWVVLLGGVLCSCGKSGGTSHSEGTYRGRDESNGMMNERRRDAVERAQLRQTGLSLCSYTRTTMAVEYFPVQQSINYYFCKLSMQRCLGRESESASIQRVDLTAFEYGFSPRVIRARRGDRLIITVTSKDVPHGITIAGYGIRVPVKKGYARELRFTAIRAGEFLIQCPLCQKQGHAAMQAKLIVED
jgi:heme/copper-type cytochrome/quinol oxidase subunit 2